MKIPGAFPADSSSSWAQKGSKTELVLHLVCCVTTPPATCPEAKFQHPKQECGDTKPATPKQGDCHSMDSYSHPSRAQQPVPSNHFWGRLFQTPMAEKPACGFKQISEAFCICFFSFYKPNVITESLIPYVKCPIPAD